MKEFFKILFSYLKRSRVVVISFFLTSIIFAFVFYAFKLPVNTVLYASLIALFVLAIISSKRFYSYYKKYNKLQEIRNQISVNSVSLPEPEGSVEQILNEMIEILQKDRADMIYKKDSAISDMKVYYSTWAHQIKIPISAMELILQTEQIPHKAELSEQLFRIEEYVEMALNFVRSESMSGDLVIQTYNLDKIVKSVIKKYSKPFIRRKISLQYIELNVKVLTDKKWLSFVIEQIISNALKYTKNGKISIYMEDEETLVIQDTGIGISATDLPRIFEKGFTGYNGRGGKNSTGIGLFLCRKILNMLSHTIAIESELGVGTKVKIKFLS